MKRSSRNKNRRQYQIESCESRIALAGDVFVALEGSLLTITGDQLDNEMSVQQSSAGDVTVAGLNGTRINGLPAIRLANPQLEKLDIRMENGNDRVVIGKVAIAGDLEVQLGEGDDTVSSSATVQGSVSMFGDLGNDMVITNGSQIGGDLNVDLGLGTGRARLIDSTVGFNVSVVSDEANDIIALDRVRAGGSVQIDSKSGNDNVSIVGSTALSLGVNTDLGADRVTISSVTTAEDVSISTGDGADRVSLTQLQSGKGVSVNVDAGNDTVVATNVVAAHDIVFAGGAGFDVFDNNGVTAGSIFEVKEFESFI